MVKSIAASHTNDSFYESSIENGFLLDTHTFIWAVQEPKKLGKNALKIIEDPESKLYLSSISAFEITNKYRIGKLPGCEYLVNNYTQIARKLGVIDLPVALSHTWFAGQFEWSHRDPFDRILAAQAALENLPLISNDSAFRTLNYYELLW